MGGFDNDRIESEDGADVIFGDSGQAVFDPATGNWLRLTSTAQTHGGDDTIVSGRGDDVSIGGFGGDIILGGTDGHDIILGDHGLVVGEDGSAQANDIISTGFLDGGGDDRILDDDGINYIIGGDGDDIVRSGVDRDWLAGDYADVIRGPGFVLQEFVSVADGQGGVDGLTGASGSDIIIAGTKGDIAVGGSGDDFIIGDNGRVVTNGQNLLTIESQSFETGGADTLYAGTGNDVAIGGHDGDVMYGGALNGNDILLGDNGIVHRADGSANSNDVLTTGYVDGGGDDYIQVDDGLNLVIAGRGADRVIGGSERDYVIGDYGDVTRDETSVIVAMDTSIAAPATGDRDIINAGLGDYNVAIGGAGNDEITTGHGIDVVLGDNGRTLFANVLGRSVIQRMVSTSPLVGADDLIVTGDASDYVIAGALNDAIGAGADTSRDVVMGDHGQIDFNADGLPIAVMSIDDEIGGADGIFTTDGSDIVIGGPQNDTINAGPSDTADSHPDYILGDNGIITIRSTGAVQRAETTSPDIGGNDFILSGGASDFIAGGFGDDTVQAGSQIDVVLGDNGFANFDTQGRLTDAATTATDDGGRDTISAGSGNDVVFGGFENDIINGNEGDDVLFGDNGDVNMIINDGVTSTVDVAQTHAPNHGGEDQIFGDAGRDRIVGGTFGDTIQGNADHDIIFGDHARFDSSLPANQNFTSTFVTSGDDGGRDTINGNAGDDFIIGGQDNDTVFGDVGDDDIIGGHNVRFGADGDDTIEGGDQADVILGDNGTIHRTLSGSQIDVWQKHPAPFADVVREIQRYDDIDRIGGNDTIYGDNKADVPGDVGGDDIIHGQRGDDVIHGRGGDDELIGELGDDTITGGDGHDTILSDVGFIHREFIDPSTPRIDRNGKWHRDIVLEEVAELSGVVDMDQTPMLIPDADLAQKLLTTDITILAGGFDASGEQKHTNTNGAWDSDALLLDLTDENNDTVDGGAGDDLIFGQRGNDELRGGADNDFIFGDNATNTVPYYTDVPKVVHTYRLIAERTPAQSQAPQAIHGINIDEFGSVIVTPYVQRPEEFNLNNPYNLPDVQSTVMDPLAVEIANAGPLQRADGTTTKPYVSVISDIAHHQTNLPGNDQIFGDGGDDLIVGDDATVATPLVTGIQSIEFASDDAYEAFAAAMHVMGTLSSDYATLNDATTGLAKEIAVAQDTIEGGAGDDTIVGDDALFIADFILGLPADAANYVPTAIDLQTYYGDLTHLATDFEFMTFAAHHAVLTELADVVGTTTTLNEDVHDFSIGNDTISGREGADHVTGDHAVVLTPIIRGQQFAFVGTSTSPLSPAAQTAANAALTANLTNQRQTLSTHVANHHDASALTLTPAQVAALPPDYEFDLSIGNDAITTSEGDDFVVADFGAYGFPVFLATTVPTKEDVNDLTNDMTNWLASRQHQSSYDQVASGNLIDTYSERAGAAGEATILAGNDIVHGGRGNDAILGDSVSISTATFHHTPGIRFAGDDALLKVEIYDRQAFELVGHFSLGNGTRIEEDLVTGGDGDDTLFGQRGIDNLSGNGDDDELYGGSNIDTLDGGGQPNDFVSQNTEDTPENLELDRFEDYQFNTIAPATLSLIEDTGNVGGDVTGNLQFQFDVGKFVSD